MKGTGIAMIFFVFGMLAVSCAAPTQQSALRTHYHTRPSKSITTLLMKYLCCQNGNAFALVSSDCRPRYSKVWTYKKDRIVIYSIRGLRICRVSTVQAENWLKNTTFHIGDILKDYADHNDLILDGSGICFRIKKEGIIYHEELMPLSSNDYLHIPFTQAFWQRLMDDMTYRL